jgi:hypothetical protein
MQRAIVIPAGSQHEKTCRAYPQTTPYLHVHVGNRSGQSAGHAACCLLPATIAHTRRLHRPSYHCHTVAQFHLETEHSSKPSRPRVSQRLWAHQDEMIYGLRTCASLVANTLPRATAPGNYINVCDIKYQYFVASLAASIAVSVRAPAACGFFEHRAKRCP